MFVCFKRYTRVTRLTERHEIMHIVGAALTERKHMVYFLGWRQPTSLLALLAERVRLDEAVADTLPASTVALVCLRLTLEVIVMMVHLLLMLGAVKTARQLRTAGVLARALWFLWHDVTSIRAQRKPCGIYSHKALSILFS